jgi:stalled ribosome rescue protein Dom34
MVDLYLLQNTVSPQKGIYANRCVYASERASERGEKKSLDTRVYLKIHIFRIFFQTKLVIFSAQYILSLSPSPNWYW